MSNIHLSSSLSLIYANSLEFPDNQSRLPSQWSRLLTCIFCPHRPDVSKSLQDNHVPTCRVYKRTSLMSSSLLLQQYPACLVRLTWMVVRWEVSGRIAVVLRVLPSGFVQDSKQNSCVVLIELFLKALCQRPCGASIS